MSPHKNYETSLREPTLDWIKEVGAVDILVGIPTYNNDDTIGFVVSQVGEGLKRYYGDLKTAILVADGGSVDDTRENIHAEKIPDGVEKQVTIYRGIPGKGTSFRAVFECATRLKAKAVLVFDSDLRSITPEWVKKMADPILSGEADFCAPWYRRHQFDGTITNMIVYPLSSAIFGSNIRQPIGGDFSFGLKLAEHYAGQPVWLTDVARFGIDIWMSMTAVNEGFKVAQVDLGNKIHNPKDPAADLGLMFYQVVSTLFGLIGSYEDKWRRVSGVVDARLISSDGGKSEPEKITVSLDKMKREFEDGYFLFKPMYRQVLTPETYEDLSIVVSRMQEKGALTIEADLWSRILYDFCFTFHHWQRNRRRLIDILTPLYYGRTGTYCTQVLTSSWEEAEAVVQNQAEVFRSNRSYLINKYRIWE
ncbi:MAG: glycosyltransferase [Nitrospirota bacterium]|nr:glycosyltransferase [Nitrospirota bacterium]